MSIIQEALKKAERQIKDAKTPQAAASGSSSQGSPHPIRTSPAGAAETPKPSAGSDPKAVAALLAILVIAAVVAASQLFPGKAVSKTPASETPAGRPREQPVSPKSSAVPPKAEEFPTLTGIVFQRQQTEEARPAVPEFVLNGIMYLEGHPRAIINGSMIEPGDMLSGARVVKIEKKYVLLEYNGSEIRLDLK